MHDEGPIPAGARSPEEIRKRRVHRFLGEAQVMAQLDHPGIVPLHGLGIDPKGRAYFTMRLVHGDDLSHVIARAHEGDSNWTPARLVEVLVKVAETLAYAHSKGVVHRDLKPDNVRVGRFGAVYVLDWGLARLEGRDDEESARMRAPSGTETAMVRTDVASLANASPDARLLTLDGDTVGTPAYMPPEQAEGDLSKVGPQSDVYAVGAMLYQAISGSPPYVATGSHVSPYAVLAMVLTAPPVPLRERKPDTPPELLAICERAMARDRGQRYATMQELADDLRAFLEGRVVRAYQTGAVAELRKWIARNRTTAVLVATVLMLVVVGSVLGTIVIGGKNRTLAATNEDLEEAVWSAEAATELADRRASEVRRLADGRLLEMLRRKAEELWPLSIELVEEYESWISDASELTARLAVHEQTLATLRERALEYTDADAQRDRETHPLSWKVRSEEEIRAKEIEILEAALVGEASGTRALEGADPEFRPPTYSPRELQQRIDARDVGIAAMRAAISSRRTWVLPDDEDQWQHDALAALVDGLHELLEGETNSIPELRERIRRAREIHAATVEDEAAQRRWKTAIASIGDLDQCPRYGGLELQPIPGLLPLRRDPASKLWEFAHLQSGKPAEIDERDEARRYRITEETGIVLVLIPGGQAVIGAQNSDPSAPNFEDRRLPRTESPVHELTLNPYFLSKYEMTQGQWRRVMGDNPSAFRADNPRVWHIYFNATHPVENLPWGDADRAVRRLGLALPTEVQWEYGARAGTTTSWWSGADPGLLPRVANRVDKSANRAGGQYDEARKDGATDDGIPAHGSVDVLAPNPFGLHNVHGNVWEWCRDRYGWYGDPTEPGTGERLSYQVDVHVARGGSFSNNPGHARSAFRNLVVPGGQGLVGLRPSLDLTAR
jgi:formylglycine-generating enzyme required for sulfatase activity